MIYALPGFLGLASDWECLNIAHLTGVEHTSLPFQSLQEWAEHFNRQVLQSKTKPSILMGYSLGARLALHALIDRPEQWEGAIIISGHSGLKNSEDKERRKMQDREWANRFLYEEWDALMKSWNEQEVFTSDPYHFKRMESDYQREHLADLLLKGSLGRQEDLSERVAKLPLPLLWVTGKEDHRFCKIAKEIQFTHPKSKRAAVPNAGHRVPWVQPEKFKQEVEQFLVEIGAG